MSQTKLVSGKTILQPNERVLVPIKLPETSRDLKVLRIVVRTLDKDRDNSKWDDKLLIDGFTLAGVNMIHVPQLAEDYVQFPARIFAAGSKFGDLSAREVTLHPNESAEIRFYNKTVRATMVEYEIVVEDGTIPEEGSAMFVLAQEIEADLLDRGKNLDGLRLKRFQTEARIVVDGLYGPETALALARVLGHDAPDPLRLPGDVPPTTPARSSIVDELGRGTPASMGRPPATKNDGGALLQLATRVEADIAAHGKDYDADMLRAFQTEAKINVDGRYGRETYRALSEVLGHAGPEPLKK